MRFKATVFLSLIFVFLGLYLFYVELPGEKKKEEAELKEKRLFSFSDSEVTNLIIRRPGEEIELENHPEHPIDPWRMVRPVATVADERTASALTSQLKNLVSSRIVEEHPTDLKPFGLDPPEYSVIVTLNGADTEILDIGTESLTGRELYVRKGEGTPVYLVPTEVKQALIRPLNDWRRRELFQFSASDVHRIRMESPKQQIELSREGEGWAIKKPVAAKGDASEIANLLGSLVNLKGEAFIDVQKEEKKRELGTPILEVDLGVDQVERKAAFYELKNEPEMIYAVTTPQAPIYKISRESFVLFNQPASAFRDKKVISLADPQEVEEITITRPEETLQLEKKEGRWSIKGAVPSQAVQDGQKIFRFLIDLREMRAEEFIDRPPSDPSRAGLADPALSIHLKGKDGKALGEVAFGRLEGEKVYARSSGQPTPFLLKKDALNQIPEKKDLVS